MSSLSFVQWDAVVLGLVATAIWMAFATRMYNRATDQMDRDAIAIFGLIAPLGWWLSWIPIGLSIIILDWWHK